MHELLERLDALKDLEAHLYAGAGVNELERCWLEAVRWARTVIVQEVDKEESEVHMAG